VQEYERMGFSIAEAIVMDIGGGFVMDDYRMEKPVSAASQGSETFSASR
jgi:hypothetical protein